MKKLSSLLLVALLLGCGGGGGGGSSSGGNTGNPSPAANVTGSWGGLIDRPDIQVIGGITHILLNWDAIYINIQKTDNKISGTFMTQYIKGNVSGTIYDNNININMVSTDVTCNGSYSGSGTVSDDNIIEFRYSGSDCLQSYDNKWGNIFKLMNVVSNSGDDWSGHWYLTGNDNSMSISLDSTNKLNYVGRFMSINKRVKILGNTEVDIIIKDIYGTRNITNGQSSMNLMDMFEVDNSLFALLDFRNSTGWPLLAKFTVNGQFPPGFIGYPFQKVPN